MECMRWPSATWAEAKRTSDPRKSRAISITASIMTSDSSQSPADHSVGPALCHALAVFCQNTLPARLELEILPSAFQLPPSVRPSVPLLTEGPALAIRRADLVRAFVHARGVFAAPAGPAAVAHADDARFAATYAMLLLQPEHLTAANYRKRALLRLRRSEGPGGSSRAGGGPGRSERLQQALAKELAFTASLLTSPLDKHPRSPTLWSHREWILREFRAELGGGSADGGQRSGGAAGGDARAEARAEERRVTLGLELKVVLAAGERHAANYYAWMHGRRAMSVLLPGLLVESLKRGDRRRPEVEAEALRDAVEMVRSWCLAHPRDISGWTFLAHTLHRLGDTALEREVLESVERFAQDTGWEGESVKRFLGMIAEPQLSRRESSEGPRTENG